MRSDDAEARLRALLAEAGVDVERPSAADVGRTWEVMRAFAREPVEDAEPPDEDGDGILAQYGIDDGGDGARFELDMTRQFTFADADGEYDHMSQLQCTFRFEPTPELRSIGSEEMWSFGMPVDAFFDAALDLPGFRHVAESGPDPVSLDIHYGEV